MPNEIDELKEKIKQDEEIINKLNAMIEKKTLLANDNILGTTRILGILIFCLILGIFKSEVLIRIIEIIFNK